MITASILAEAVECRDGNLFWRLDRPASHFLSNRAYKIWFTKCAGKLAGHQRKDGYRTFTLSYLGEHFPVLSHVATVAITTGVMPTGIVDHGNGDRSDNSIDNLSVTNRHGNNKNMLQRRDNSTGVTGIHYCVNRGKWVVQGHSNGVRRTAKRYSDFFEAICARKSWEIKEEFSARHGTRKEGLQ